MLRPALLRATESQLVARQLQSPAEIAVIVRAERLLCQRLGMSAGYAWTCLCRAAEGRRERLVEVSNRVWDRRDTLDAGPW